MKGNPDRKNVVSFAEYAPLRFLSGYLRNAGVIMFFVDELHESFTATGAPGAGLLKSLLNCGACLQSIQLGGELGDEH